MSASVRRSSPVVATPRSYVRRSAEDDRVQAGLRAVAELRVQRAHGDIALLAAGDEPAEAGLLRRRDLRPLQRGRDAASAPRALHRGEAVVGVPAEVVERGVTDRLVAVERDEEELRPARGALDLDRQELLVRPRAGRARNVGN